MPRSGHSGMTELDTRLETFEIYGLRFGTVARAGDPLPRQSIRTKTE